MEPDFGGWATKNDLVCSDGLVIRRNAFAKSDGQTVPLVWQHGRNDPTNILGHARLKNKPDGVYAEAYFNDTPAGQSSKLAVQHGDINALSINGIKIQKNGRNIIGGEIKEVSLVLRGANPGASIDYVNLSHSDGDDDLDEAVIYTGLTFDHMAEPEETTEEEPEVEDTSSSDLEHAETTEENTDEPEKGEKVADSKADITVKEKYDSLDEDTKTLINYFVGLALESVNGGDDDDEDVEQNDQYEGDSVNHNIFDGGMDFDGDNGIELSHADVESIFKNAHRPGVTLKDAVLDHADEYGITNINLLFPDAQAIRDTPDFVNRRTEWVAKVLDGVVHSPFAKIKSMSADITLDTARAKGYVKGSMKKEEFFALQKRETSPATIYKKQKLDRDDILDITSFDVVVWLKGEMRIKLDEEIARAILIGDGRDVDDPDKIADPAGNGNGRGIRSILHDHPFYAHQVLVPANVSGEAMTEAIIRGMDNYKGTGVPTMFTARKVRTDWLLLKDKLGRRLYTTEADLVGVLQVKEIVPVELFDEEPDLIAIVVNLRDYSVGSNAGGEISFFDDFDIDFNQHKYLIETRLSGALTLPKSALIVRRASGTKVTPEDPTFNAVTHTITIPSVSGVRYFVNEELKTGSVVITEDAIVSASPAEGYYFPANTNTEWVFEYKG